MPINCQCDFVTNIVLKPKSCEGLFVFSPEIYSVPNTQGSSGPNLEICPLDINVLENCKGDLKLTLLDDNGCNLDCLVLRCSQYDVSALGSILPVAVGVDGLFTATPDVDLSGVDTNKYGLGVKINANNLNLMGEYIAFEEAANYYRQVTQTYLNLWCGGERNGVICDILENAAGIAANILPIGNGPALQAQAWALGQNLIKARVIALKQLCECGKVCNDQFFPVQTNPCQAIKGCCRY